MTKIHRTRVNDNREVIPSFSTTKTNTETDCSSNSVDTSYAGPFYLGTMKVTTDVVTPRFHERSAKGEINNSPFSSVTTTQSIMPDSYAYKFPLDPAKDCAFQQEVPNSYLWTTYRGVGSKQVGHLGGSRINGSDLRLQAMTTAVAGISAPEVQGLVSLAELRETISFLRRPAKAWTDFAKRAKRHKNRGTRKDKAKSVAQFLSDNWLSYRYGVRPIVMDVQNGMKALKYYNDKQPKRFTARGSASDSDTRTSNYGLGVYSCEHQTKFEMNVRAGVLYELEEGYDVFGVNYSQIPVAAWEVIPFSFVADWFVNIGSYVEAITPKSGARELARWTTTKEVKTSDFSCIRTSVASPRELFGQAPGLEYLQTTSVTRVPSGTIGLVRNRLPFTGDIGTKRIVDAFALANNILLSK